MRKILPLALLGLLALCAPGRAGCWLGGCCPPCKPIPCPECPDCGCPCENRHSILLCDKSAEYIATLRSIGCTGTAGCAGCGGCGDCGCGSNCCERIKAAEKLGDRLHADFCCNPEVLEALIGALQCDPCWEVRKAAAWSIMLQGARTEEGVLALYVASKVDPHYMVRAEAAQALDILTVCRRECFTELYKVGDTIAVELRARKFKPGMDNCCGIVGEAYGAGRAARIKAAVAEAAKKAEEDAKKGFLPPGAVMMPPGAVIVQPGVPVMPPAVPDGGAVRPLRPLR